MIQIQIKKAKSPLDRSILTCTRSDGSSTWHKLHKGTELHDVAHAVVESTLGFKNAFYGLLDRGFEISDFAKPPETRPDSLHPRNLPQEALQTEQIVNLLMTWHSAGLKQVPLNQLSDILSKDKLPLPKHLDQNRLDLMKKRFSEFVFQWHSVPPGESLHIELDLN